MGLSFVEIIAFFSTVGLAQAWDQLDQLAMRMQHNLEQQIQARNQSGVTEEALREFSMMFKHYDKVVFFPIFFIYKVLVIREAI